MNALRPGPGIVLAAMIATLVTSATLGASAAPMLAQAGPDVLAQQSLRPYGYVFAAYALAWLLLMGWVLSIGSRLRKLEQNAGPGDRDA